jgi:hypothetical protein
MSLFRRKKVNRRRPAPRKRVKAGALLRRVPRPRLPRGRAAVAPVAVLLLFGLAAWQGGKAYMRGGILTVSRLDVQGSRHWPAARLLETAGVDVGRRLHEIPFGAARARLLALPGIEEASVRYVPGGTLRLHVREAEAVAARRFASGWRGLTPAGEWMPFSDEVPEDVPVMEAGGSPRALAVAAAWLAGVRERRPELFAGFSQIALRGGDGEADVYWRDGRVRLRVDCARAPGAVELAGELLSRDENGWRDGATVDLRVEGYAYVR